MNSSLPPSPSSSSQPPSPTPGLLQQLRERQDSLPEAQRSVVRAVLDDPRAAVAQRREHFLEMNGPIGSFTAKPIRRADDLACFHGAAGEQRA